MTPPFFFTLNGDLVVLAMMHNGGKRYRFGFVGLVGWVGVIHLSDRWVLHKLRRRRVLRRGCGGLKKKTGIELYMFFSCTTADTSAVTNDVIKAGLPYEQ